MFLSAQSFSGEIDGKGLDCTLLTMIESGLDKDLPEEYKPEKVWQGMFWFNNGLVATIRGGISIDYPKRKKLKKSDDYSLEYKTDDTNIYWKFDNSLSSYPSGNTNYALPSSIYINHNYYFGYDHPIVPNSHRLRATAIL